MFALRPFALRWLVLVVFALLVACGGDGGTTASGSDAPRVQPGAADGDRGGAPTAGLNVMSFNVWYGGNAVDFGQVGAAIRKAEADVVGLQEPEGNTRRIAEAAGLPYVDESLHLISRYPLYAAERGGVRFAYVAVDPDNVAAIANVHLTATPYGPQMVRDGESGDEVIDTERGVRLPEITPYLDPLAGLAEEGVPVFLTGDMNAPSHLDWTEEAARSREQVKFPVQWPVSKALAGAGIRDSYREAHPDPAANPGITWTPGTPPPVVRDGEPLDRIDFVMASGPAKTLDSRLVGEEGGPDVEVGVSPWPSDHRAVVSAFGVDAAPTPALVDADPRVLEKGERVTVRFALPDRDENRKIGIMPGGGDEPLLSLPIYRGRDHVAAMFGTAGLETGRHRAVLLNADGSAAATSDFWVQAEDAVPEVEVAGQTLAPGEPVEVEWRNAPGNHRDWVGIYKAGDPDLYNYFGFLYTGGMPEGEIEFTGQDLSGGLKPGRYEARLLLDDGYAQLAAAPFTVEEDPR